jgi:ATP-dependent Clp protease, protease subunit
MGNHKWFEVNAKAETGRAEIFIFGPIVNLKWHEDEVGAKGFIDQLKPLGDIDLHINSNGGSVPAASAIYNALRRHPGTVDVYVDGMALSAASFIAMAGRKVIMPANAVMMIHDPASEVWGNAAMMRRAADMLDKFKVGLVEAYREKSGLDAEKVGQMMSGETWMTAEEAVNLGFADEIEAPLQLAASLDLSHLRNVPTALLAAPGKHTETTPEALARMSKQAFRNRAN